jgi:hypothetical protein
MFSSTETLCRPDFIVRILKEFPHRTERASTSAREMPLQGPMEQEIAVKARKAV